MSSSLADKQFGGSATLPAQDTARASSGGGYGSWFSSNVTTLSLIWSIVVRFARSILLALLNACIRIATPPTNRFSSDRPLGYTVGGWDRRRTRAPNRTPSFSADQRGGAMGDGYYQQRRHASLMWEPARGPSRGSGVGAPHIARTRTSSSTSSTDHRLPAGSAQGPRLSVAAAELAPPKSSPQIPARSLEVPVPAIDGDMADTAASRCSSEWRGPEMQSSQVRRSSVFLVPVATAASHQPTESAYHRSSSNRHLSSSRNTSLRRRYGLRTQLPSSHTEEGSQGREKPVDGAELGLRDLKSSPAEMGLQGRSLGILGPTSLLRRRLAHVFSLRRTSVLMSALLIAQFVACASANLREDQPVELVNTWGGRAKCFIFLLITLEALARIAVTGFAFDARGTPAQMAAAIEKRVPVVASVRAAWRKRRSSLDLSERDGAGAPVTDADEPPVVPHGDADGNDRQSAKSGGVRRQVRRSRSCSVGSPRLEATGARGCVPAIATPSSPPAAHCSMADSSIPAVRVHADDFDGNPQVMLLTSPKIRIGDEDDEFGHWPRHRHHSRPTSRGGSAEQHARSSSISGSHRRSHSAAMSNASLYSYPGQQQQRWVPGGHPAIQRTSPMRAYLRHTYNCIDLASIVAFWIAAILSSTGKHESVVRLFEAISTIRFVRLMNLTPGSFAVVQSLKRSAPMLSKVSLYMGYFFLFFATLGVSLFKGAFTRRCVSGATQEETLPERYCGSYMQADKKMPYFVAPDQHTVLQAPKAYACPNGQICMTVGNPDNRLMNFDNIFSSAVQVFIVASAQGWTDIMYIIMDSVSYVSAIYFVACVMLIQLWLVNLFVAVINETFAKMREENDRARALEAPRQTVGLSSLLDPVLNRYKRHRADGSARRPHTAEELLALGGKRNWARAQWLRVKRRARQVWTPVARWGHIQGMQDVWCLLVIVDLFYKVWWKVNPTKSERRNYLVTNLVVTILFDIEILWRMVRAWNRCARPRNAINFLYHMVLLDQRPIGNVADIIIAIADSIMEYGTFSDTQMHRFMYVFASLRTYRLIENFPKSRQLMHSLKGSIPGLLSVILTIGLTIFIGAAVSMQLIGGAVPEYSDDGEFIQMRYDTYPHALLSTYQLFSGADWTDLLWEATGYVQEVSENWIVAIYMCAFYYFTNYILLNMMIALIMDNFETSEKEKRVRQLAVFYASLNRSAARYKRSLVSRWNPYLYLKPSPVLTKAPNLPKSLVFPMRKDYSQAFLLNDGKRAPHHSLDDAYRVGSSGAGFSGGGGAASSGVYAYDKDYGSGHYSPVSGGLRRRKKRKSDRGGGIVHEVGKLLFGKSVAEQRVVARDPSDPSSGTTAEVLQGISIVDDEAATAWEATRRNFEAVHPTYNKSLFVFSPDSKLRRFCCILDSGHPLSGGAASNQSTSSSSSGIMQFGSAVANPSTGDGDAYCSTESSSSDDTGSPKDDLVPLMSSEQASGAQSKGQSKAGSRQKREAKRRRMHTADGWRYQQIYRGSQAPIDPVAHRLHKWMHYTWLTAGLAATMLSVICLCTDTPIRRKYYIDKGEGDEVDWIFYATLGLAIFTTLEVVVKAIAHGFAIAPHASMKSLWNVIDLVVCVSLYVSLLTLDGGSSATRFVRFLRSLRTMRLIGEFKAARDAFYNVLVSGIPRILVAMWLMFLLLIPCAILAHKMWQNLLYQCSDGGAEGRTDCIGEYFHPDLGILLPRTWSNPYNYNFDTFGYSLSILFTVISNEGWTDVVSDTMAIRGLDLQPSPNYSWWNSLWWVAYIMFATVFVLYVFIGIIVANYTQRTGSAFLTTEQRRWLDLKIQLRAIRPPMMPKSVPKSTIRRWCLDCTVKRNTWYTRLIATAVLANCMVLLATYSSRPVALLYVQHVFQYIAYAVFVLDFFVHMIGLGVKATLRSRNYQMLIFVALIIVLFQFIFTTAGISSLGSVLLLYKFALVSDTLNEMTRVITGGFRPILSLFWVWMVITMIYAFVCVELWGLTRLGPESNAHANFWTFGSAFLTLLRFSYGENWNYLITDLQVSFPNCVVAEHGSYLQTDCGHGFLTYLVFASYNLISMYIFVNVFIGVVTDNFQYCYQSSTSYKLLTRQEIREFRMNWWKFDPQNTGYIPREKYIEFFNSLKPPFSIAIYNDKLTIRSLVKRLKTPAKPSDKVVHVEIDRAQHTQGTAVHCNLTRESSPEPLSYDLNISELQRALNEEDVRQASMNRRLFNRIYQEALLIDDPKHGMGFTQMLIFLARNKMVDPNANFLVEEALRYRDLSDRVDDALREKYVQGLMETVIRRRKFLTAQKLQHRFLGQNSLSPSMADARDADMHRWSGAQTTNSGGYSIPLLRINQPELTVPLDCSDYSDSYPGSPTSASPQTLHPPSVNDCSGSREPAQAQPTGEMMLSVSALSQPRGLDQGTKGSGDPSTALLPVSRSLSGPSVSHVHQPGDEQQQDVRDLSPPPALGVRSSHRLSTTVPPRNLNRRSTSTHSPGESRQSSARQSSQFARPGMRTLRDAQNVLNMLELSEWAVGDSSKQNNRGE